jgi:hypothetical protein
MGSRQPINLNYVKHYPTQDKSMNENREMKAFILERIHFSSLLWKKSSS